MTDLRTPSAATEHQSSSPVSGAAGSAAEQGQAVAQTAVSEAKDVAGHAKDQAATLAAETKDQALKALSSATSEVETQLEQRLGDVTSTARTTAEELRALCEGRPEDAGRTADLARQASQRLDRFAERTDQLGVRGAAEEIADFGRRRPVAFLLGATVAGVLVGRMARAGKSVSDSGSSPSVPSSLTPPPQVAAVAATPPSGSSPTAMAAPVTAPAFTPSSGATESGGPPAGDAPTAVPPSGTTRPPGSGTDR